VQALAFADSTKKIPEKCDANLMTGHTVYKIAGILPSVYAYY